MRRERDPRDKAMEASERASILAFVTRLALSLTARTLIFNIDFVWHSILG